MLFNINICISKNSNDFPISTSIINNEKRIKQVYEVPTPDDQLITLIRYVGFKKIPIILIHGMGGNHLMLDFDENHSLSRFLNDQGWDVWMLDLRTHDGDGDYYFVKGSDREFIFRYWDFDRTLLKLDVVTAVDFVKKVTLNDKIFLGGHSYGGYLAYAYAMKIGEENLTGIITTGASPYSNPKSVNFLELLKYGFPFGKRAFVNPFGMPWTFMSKLKANYFYSHWTSLENSLFYYTTTPEYIQKNLLYHFDSEPAGVWVDMYYGKDPNKYSGHWVDPQTLYDYSANLYKITVPILFIAGLNDTQDPSKDIFKAYQNVSSEVKEFYSFPEHSHLDLLLGENASKLIFPKISNWVESVIYS
jgi:pimeloyl-ACP methyl ester carboxylesterase